MAGSAALEICQVAMGRHDAFYEFGIHAWDIAAAVCIAEEAGAVVSAPDGLPLNLMTRRILVASSSELASSIAASIDSNVP